MILNGKDDRVITGHKGMLPDTFDDVHEFYFAGDGVAIGRVAGWHTRTGHASLGVIW